jgi:hypothetical protein
MNPMTMGRVAQTTTVETKQLIAWINFFFIIALYSDFTAKTDAGRMWYTSSFKVDHSLKKQAS